MPASIGERSCSARPSTSVVARRRRSGHDDGLHRALATITDGAKRVEEHHAGGALGPGDGRVHREVAAPRVSDEDDRHAAEVVHHCPEVIDELRDRQRPVGGRGRQPALLVARHAVAGERVGHLIGDAVHVVGHPRAAVEQGTKPAPSPLTHPPVVLVGPRTAPTSSRPRSSKAVQHVARSSEASWAQAPAEPAARRPRSGRRCRRFSSGTT